MKKLRRHPYDKVCHCSDCFIRDNIFQNNDVNDSRTSVIQLDRQMQEVVISRNSFFDTDKPGCSIRAPIQFIEDGKVDAKRNFWATTDIQKIYARLCSAHIYTFVDVVPFYSDQAKTQEMSPGYIVNGNQLGGEVKGRITISPPTPASKCFYRMLHSTYIPKGAVLIIQAGCTIEFDKNVGIVVDGDLVFGGTEDRPVRLLYSTMADDGGKWAGIIYGNNGKPQRLNLENIVFQDAMNAISLRQSRPPTHIEINPYPVEVTLVNIHVNNSDSAFKGINGFFASHATYRIRNSRFFNSGTAIISGYNNNNRIVMLIDNCVFDRNNVSVMATSYNLSQITITNSTFSNGNPANPSRSLCQLQLRMTNSTILIRNNTFSSNNEHMICLDIDRPNGVCNVNNNVFNKNKNSAGILISFRSIRDVEIKGNEFTENENPSGTACIVMNPSMAPTRNSLDIHHNQFVRNKGLFILNLVNHHWPTMEPHVKVHTNAFDDNYASRATINAAIISSSITENNFQNPRTRIDVRAGIRRSPRGNEINCINNYWGITDVTQIEGKILDRNDSRKRIRVKFRPYKNAPNSDAMFT